MKKKTVEREKGFNVFLSGANEERIKDQRRNEIMKERAASNSDQQKGQRRMWRNPSLQKDDMFKNDQQTSQFQYSAKYHNPFEIGHSKPPPSLPKPQQRPVQQQEQPFGKSPAKIRKKWGEVKQQDIQFNLNNSDDKKESQNNDDDQYSDSFEEQNTIEVTTQQNTHQKLNKSRQIQEQSIRESYQDQDIEQFLRTITKQEIQDLKTSISNWDQFKKQTQKEVKKEIKKDVKKEDETEDYIEEEFEQDIPEVNSDEQNSEEEEKQYQQLKFEQNQQKLQNQSQKTKSQRNRPISATFDLAQARIIPNKKQQPVDNFVQQQKQSSFVAPQENKSIRNNAGIMQQPKLYQVDKDKIVQQTPKQLNDTMKKPINTNPFKRPFSQNISVRPNKIQKNKTDQQEMPKQEEKDFGIKSEIHEPAKGYQVLLQRIERLDDAQKDQLMQILNDLEGNSMQSSNHSNYIQKNIDLNFLSPPKNSDKLQNPTSYQVQPKQRANNEIIIRVISTFGYNHACGLTEIELFDDKAQKIVVMPKSIETNNLGAGPKFPIEKLINGNKVTNDDKQMWLGYLPPPGKKLEILIHLNKDIQVGALRFWNYNKSVNDYTKGIKEVEILLNDELKWKGNLNGGKGKISDEYVTSISLIQNIVLPQAIEQKKEAFDEVIEEDEEESKLDIQNQNSQLKDAKQQAVFKQKKMSHANLDSFQKAPLWLQGTNQQQVQQETGGTPNSQDLQKRFAGYPRENPPDVRIGSKQQQSRPSQYRDQPKELTNSKPNLALAGNQSNTSRQKPQEIQNTVDSIKEAVTKVNEAINIHKKPKLLVEDSLDNLDFFKITNLGRLGSQFDKEYSSQKVEHSPQRSLQQDTQLLSSKQGRNAHVVVKNPFPQKEKSSTKQSTRKQSLDTDDILDQILGSNQDTNKKNKGGGNDIFDINQLQKSNRKTEKLTMNDQQEMKVQHQPKKNLQNIEPSNKASQNQTSSLIDTFSSSFEIPSLPIGQKLFFNILTTWGDLNYVGLAGIEIYDIEGNPVKIDEQQISAFPPDINVLPGYGGDPRTVDKLIDGHYFTNDDLHLWLTPFTSGEDHTITIDLPRKTQISMIRIWNYNKSRIHSYRGARLITCQLDNKYIFKGEISKAPGNLNDPENSCEIMLFTDNHTILQRIDQNDWINETFITQSTTDLESTQRFMDSDIFDDNRPMTATKKFNTQVDQQEVKYQPTSLFDERPQTSAIMQGGQESTKDKLLKKQQEISGVKKDLNTVEKKSQPSIKGQKIEIDILETWGDLFYVGLNGIEIIDSYDQLIPLNIKMINANPRDMNSISGCPGGQKDHRTLDKVIDGNNNTKDDHHMWLIPFNKGEHHTVTINLGKPQVIKSIVFHNYNKSDEDTLRGAKTVVITVDSKLVTPKKGITLRKGPGLVCKGGFGQEILLPFNKGWSTQDSIPITRKNMDILQIGLFQEYDPLNLPMGFSFKFNLYSTHGDFYYIGLNGIELYDQNGYIIKVTKIFAYPSSLNQLKGMEGDMRTIDKVIDGHYQTYDDTHMWLAPFKNTKSSNAANNIATSDDPPRSPNYVCFMFDEPKAISAIRIWNYAKTPARGVLEFELCIDDRQVYRGFAKKAPEKQEWDSQMNKDFSTTIIFTPDNKLVDKFRNNVLYDPLKQQEVVFINEKKVMNQEKLKSRREENFQPFQDMVRPHTMVMKD